MRTFDHAVMANADNTGLPGQSTEFWNGNDPVAVRTESIEDLDTSRLFDLEIIATIREGTTQKKAWSGQRFKRTEAVVDQSA